MTSQFDVVEALEILARRREERRAFLRTSARLGLAAGAVSVLAACDSDGDDDEPGQITQPPPAPSGPVANSDNDILNFALNLEYLEANFYSLAVTGTGIPANQSTGAGTQGALRSTGAGAVPFGDQEVRRLAQELAADERAHVAFIRGQLGSAAIAQPAIDLTVSPTSAFSNAARSAGLIGAGATFNQFASDENFLLAAFLLADVGVTAYKGSAPLLTSKTVLEASAGILATEAYHAGLIRTTLFGRGIAAPAILNQTVQISDARDSLDGPTDLDQGLLFNGEVNLVPADANSIAFSRSPGQVLNIAYLTRTAATSGGFFPTGVNGTIRTSNANA